MIGMECCFIYLFIHIVTSTVSLVSGWCSHSRTNSQALNTLLDTMLGAWQAGSVGVKKSEGE